MNKITATQSIYNREQTDLLAEARTGSTAAFERIMRQNNRRLYRIARGILNDPSEAEDVVQETYLRAFTHLQDIRNPYALKSWLGRTAANEALGRLRQRKPTQSLDLDRNNLSASDVSGQEAYTQANVVNLAGLANTENPELTAMRREMLHLVETVVENMPMIYRSVFMLRAIEGLTTEETAICLGISKEVVKTRYHRARMALNEEMQQMAMSVLADVFSFDGAKCDRIIRRTLENLARITAIQPL